MYELVNIIKDGNTLKIKDYGGYESRNKSSIALVAQCLKNIDKNLEFNIFTGDKPLKNINNIKTFSYSTVDGDYDSSCPDFLFHSWKEVGINSYTDEIQKINLVRNSQYEINKIGWIGSGTDTVAARKLLYNYYLSNKDILDIHVTNFKKNTDGTVGCHNFLTREQQIKKWKYVLDVEGIGYSARLKLLMWSGRPVFLIDRPYKEFFYKFLEPWKHYIPVSKDLSDLKENFKIIENDAKLYNLISKNSIEFCEKFLTKEYALFYWKQILEKI